MICNLLNEGYLAMIDYDKDIFVFECLLGIVKVVLTNFVHENEL